MTDEEKALASFKKNYCPYCDNKMDCDISLVDCTSYDTMYRQSYLEGLAEGRKDRNCINCSNHGKQFEVMKLKKENAELNRDNTELFNSVTKLNNKITELEKENEELKAQVENYKLSENESKEIIAELKENHESDKRSLSLIVDKGLKLEEQIEKMKNSCLDVMKIQGVNLSDNYMAGMYNGMVVVYNSCFLDENKELKKSFCSKNENDKWEFEE